MKTAAKMKPMSYAKALEIGTRRNEEAMAEAKKRAAQNGKCNGTADCESIYHLACCLRRK